MVKWKAQRRHQRRLDKAQRLARQWIKMLGKVQCLDENQREEFDRVLDKMQYSLSGDEPTKEPREELN